MTGKEKTFERGRGYTESDWAETDVPPLTDEQIAQSKPFSEVFPELAARMRKVGRPKAEAPKQIISIRLDADVISKFKATGPGWQTRMNEVLKAAKI